jgi:hypothetical protein
VARSLSSVARAAIFAQQTGEVFVLLLELDHANFTAIIRVCSDNLPVVAGGYTYSPFPFEITLPDESEETPPRVTLKIDNVDRRIVQEVRKVTGNPITVRLRVVLASSPDTIEAGPFEFSLRDVEYDAKVITGTLMFEDLLNESFPADSFTPARFKGLF